MWAMRWSPTIADPFASSTKIVSVGLCPGRSSARQPPPARLDDVAVCERPVDRRPRPAVAAAITHDREELLAAAGLRRRAGGGGAPPSPLRRSSRPARRRRSRRAARAPPPRSRSGARIVAASPTWSECWWVSTSSSTSSIRRPSAARPVSSASSASGVFGPGVDERERLAAEQPAVDRADRKRRREDDRVHGQAGGATTTAGSAANAKTDAERAISRARSRSSSQRLATGRIASHPGGARSTSRTSASTPGSESAPKASTRYRRSGPGLRRPGDEAPHPRRRALEERLLVRHHDVAVVRRS